MEEVLGTVKLVKKEQKLITTFGMPEENPQIIAAMAEGFEITQISAAASQHGFGCCVLLEKVTIDELLG